MCCINLKIKKGFEAQNKNTCCTYQKEKELSREQNRKFFFIDGLSGTGRQKKAHIFSF